MGISDIGVLCLAVHQRGLIIFASLRYHGIPSLHVHIVAISSRGLPIVQVYIGLVGDREVQWVHRYLSLVRLHVGHRACLANTGTPNGVLIRMNGILNQSILSLAGP